MFYKYRYVKVRFNGVDQDYYAYERVILWFFKSYLDVSHNGGKWWSGGMLKEENTWLYRGELSKVKSAVTRFLKTPKITITDAETKLERHLGGEE